MKKKKKKIDYKKKTVIPVLLIIVIIIIVAIFYKPLSSYIGPIYKIDDRVDNVDHYKTKYKEDTIRGWIRVQGTNIDYPIIELDQMESENKGYDFVWVNNKIDKNKNYINIFGHNILNVSSNPIVNDKRMRRFEQLMSYIYYDFVKENKYFQITIDGENYLYQIFAVGLVSKDDTEYYSKNLSKKKLDKYIKTAKKNSLFDFNTDVSSNDKIVSLTTCTRIGGSLQNDFKVDGKLVKNKNVGYNYRVKDKGKLGKIVKDLEGGGQDA